MDSEVEKLKSAIYRYKHLLKGGTIDLEKTLLLEEIEQELMKMLRDKLASEKVLDKDLISIIDTMFRDSLLTELVSTASQKLDTPVDNIEQAYKDFLTGNIENNEAKVVFVVIQAIARLKAEHEETRHGIVDMITATCPVCGAITRTMTQESTGYYMVCPFCGYKWRVSKSVLTCPFCGNKDPLSLGVFTGKKDRRLGLAWCQSCDNTWRIILDERIVKTVPRLFLPVISFGAEIYRGSIEPYREKPSNFSNDT